MVALPQVVVLITTPEGYLGASIYLLGLFRTFLGTFLFYKLETYNTKTIRILRFYRNKTSAEGRDFWTRICYFMRYGDHAYTKFQLLKKHFPMKLVTSLYESTNVYFNEQTTRTSDNKRN